MTARLLTDEVARAICPADGGALMLVDVEDSAAAVCPGCREVIAVHDDDARGPAQFRTLAVLDVSVRRGDLGLAPDADEVDQVLADAPSAYYLPGELLPGLDRLTWEGRLIPPRYLEVALGDEHLAHALARDDLAEQYGMTAGDRITCREHRTWADTCRHLQEQEHPRGQRLRSVPSTAGPVVRAWFGAAASGAR